VERATIEAASRYHPRPYDGPVLLLVPSRKWVRSGMNPLGWRAVIQNRQEYFGPDECDSDNMLLPEHAATFAELFERHQLPPSAA